MTNQFTIQSQGSQAEKMMVFNHHNLYDLQDVSQKCYLFIQSVEFYEDYSSQKQVKKEQDSNPTRDSNTWSQTQIDSLFELFQKFGSRWTKISHQMVGKSQNCIKNKFYGSLSKVFRKINKAAKNQVKKFKKELKFQSITRIIDASQGLFRLKSPLKEESQSLCKKIISIARIEQYQILPNEAEEFIKQINKFNMLTRSYKSQKKISCYSKSAPKSKKSPSTSCMSQIQKLSFASARQKLKTIDFDIDNQLNASSTIHHSMQIQKIKDEQSCLLKMQYIEEQQEKQIKVNRNSYDNIIEELDMQICSPLDCEDW